MNPEDEALRRAFAAGSDASPEGDCPAPDVLWAAAAGELPAAERRAVIDHTSRCPACAEDFRIVAEMVRAAPVAAAGSEAAAPAGRVVEGPWSARPESRRLLISMAATLLVGVLLAGLWSQLGPKPEVHRGGSEEIVSLLGANAALDRNDAVLRWKGPPGARYAVFVTTADLRLVAEWRDLAAFEARLRPEDLAAFPGGTRLDWRVEATLPDGRRLASPSFVFTVAP